MTIMPANIVSWAHDVFGIAVATAIFTTMTGSLAIETLAELELEAVALPPFEIAASANS